MVRRRKFANPEIEVNETNNLSRKDSFDTKVFQKPKKARFAIMQIGLMSPGYQYQQLARLRDQQVIGEIRNTKTLNYKTLKPEKDGLFCEKIFGPVESFVCACGKKKPPFVEEIQPHIVPFFVIGDEKKGNITSRFDSYKANYCEHCGVDFVSSRVRRYRMGFFQLMTPVAHLWFFKGRPSYLSLLLKMKNKAIEKVLYAQDGIYNCYHHEFDNKIQHLRYDQHDHVHALREFTSHNTDFVSKKYDLWDPNNPRKKVLQDFQKNKFRNEPDDFWVDSEVLGRPQTIRERFFQKTPFFSMPMMRGGLTIPFPRDEKEQTRQLQKVDFLYYGTKFRKSEYVHEYFDRKKRPGFYWREYFRPTDSKNILPTSNSNFLDNFFLNFTREEHCIPIQRYKKSLQNSFISNPVKKKRGGLLGGAPGFMHLFSKFDCYRQQESLLWALYQLRPTMKAFYLLCFEKELTRAEKKKRKTLALLATEFTRRFKILHQFWRTGTRPEWMFLQIIPILPPDLRPILELENGLLAVSDLNRHYQLIHRRNANCENFLTTAAINAHRQSNPNYTFDSNLKWGLTIEHYAYLNFPYQDKNLISLLWFNRYLLQKGVDALLENGKAGVPPLCGINKRPLKSLSEILKGKQGRFRQNLLGKRVDYSGRSVIVVGPTLKLYQCGLPKEIAVELFQSLLIQKISELNITKTIVGAKRLIQAEHPIIWPILNDLLVHYPVLLNRAPTLHRLGVQAFLPKLVRGKAILLHPLVCPPFNADFDGDQMGVHLPLSVEAKTEAWFLMLSAQNLVSPATGEPILTPSQDMVLGCYYLTTINYRRHQPILHYFSDMKDVYKAYLTKQLHPHDFIWLKWTEPFYSTDKNINVFELRIRRFQSVFQESSKMTLKVHQTFHLNIKSQKTPVRIGTDVKDQYIRTTVGRVLLNFEFWEQMSTD